MNDNDTVNLSECHFQIIITNICFAGMVLTFDWLYDFHEILSLNCPNTQYFLIVKVSRNYPCTQICTTGKDSECDTRL